MEMYQTYILVINLRKLNDAEVKELCQVKISNKFAALEKDEEEEEEDGGGGGRAWEGITENTEASATESLGYYELKQHKPLYVEECSKLLEQKKQAKLQWLQNPCQTNGDNLNNVQHETSITSRNKKREYLKENPLACFVL
jgi:hypothetical protein